MKAKKQKQQRHINKKTNVKKHKPETQTVNNFNTSDKVSHAPQQKILRHFRHVFRNVGMNLVESNFEHRCLRTAQLQVNKYTLSNVLITDTRINPLTPELPQYQVPQP